jgi:hypothetical protein
LTRKLPAPREGHGQILRAYLYPDDAVAFVPLYWLLSEAQKCGLDFKVSSFADPDSIKWIASSQDKDRRLLRLARGATLRARGKPSLPKKIGQKISHTASV